MAAQPLDQLATLTVQETVTMATVTHETEAGVMGPMDGFEEPENIQKYLEEVQAILVEELLA